MLPLEPDIPPRPPLRIRIIRGVIIVAALGAAALALLGSPWLSQFLWPGSGNAEGSVLHLTATPTAFQPTTTSTLAATPAPTPTALRPFEAGGATSLDGLMILSLSGTGYSQLFSHQLLGQPFTRLTSGAWDDIHPALSPDGQRIAFASNRGGAWDLYTLELLTGNVTQIIDDAEYDGHPSWSPDGAWLAYEHYADGDLEIFIQPLDSSVDPVRISAGNGADYAPAWRPSAQQLAFVSDRSGIPQIWLVDLEQNGDARFQPVTESVGAQNFPAWSPDGAWLAWSQMDDGIWTIYAQNISDSDSPPRRIGLGQDPHWSFSGATILAELRGPNETYLTAYTLAGGLALAPELMPSHLDGIAWGAGALPDPLPDALSAAAEVILPTVDPAAVGDTTVELSDVNAPFEELNEAALPAFGALRARAAQLLGWDALSELSNAFVPLDRPLPPARQQDWLYTGRAFELHSGLLDAGWMAIVREEFEGQTYWRVYLKAAGDLGRPLTELPWDLSARYSGTESDYQAGGELAESLLAGTWVDFTALAADYGFERVPALNNWRSYFQGTLFNLFVYRSGLTWEEAMLQVYSPEELATMAP
ncbi:MAG: hypothetical protein M1347_06115 [Chloroflexi bacterium]|nr:hypothetical protein [Chloroflexota bacterium]